MDTVRRPPAAILGLDRGPNNRIIILIPVTRDCLTTAPVINLYNILVIIAFLTIK